MVTGWHNNDRCALVSVWLWLADMCIKVHRMPYTQ